MAIEKWNGTPGQKPKVAGNIVIVSDEGECKCGCQGKPIGKKASFVQGHDMRLRGALTRAHQGSVNVETIVKGKRTTADPNTIAGEHGWELQDKPAPKARKAKSATKAKSAKASSAKTKTATKRRVIRKPAPPEVDPETDDEGNEEVA